MNNFLLVLYSLLVNYMLFIVALDGLFRQNQQLSHILFVLILLNIIASIVLIVSSQSFSNKAFVLLNLILGLLIIIFTTVVDPTYAYNYTQNFNSKDLSMFVLPGLSFMFISIYFFKKNFVDITNYKDR